jgi:integrase
MEMNTATFNMYVAPALGSVPVRKITSPMISQLLADLLDHGGGNHSGDFGYFPKPPLTGKLNDVIAETLGPKIGVAPATVRRIRRGKNPATIETARKFAAYYGLELAQAFERRREPAPLSPATVNRIAVTMSAIFASLVRAEVLTKNPVTNAVKPQIGETERGAFLDRGQLQIFMAALENIRDGNIRVALTLCLHLGLRSGEARALRWNDVDLANGIVSVNGAVGRTADGEGIGQPKTKRSRRKLPLSPYLHGLLAEHSGAQSAYAASVGSQWHGQDLVITNTTGGILSPSVLWNAVQRIIKANPGLPQDLHPHSLRHSFVSLLISSGLDVVTVASLAGDTVDIITRIYAHALKEREAAAMAQMGAVFARITTTATLAPLPMEEHLALAGA